MYETMVARMIVTPQLATAASMLVRMTHADDASLARALEKAEGRLVSQPWRIDEAGVLVITSYSRQNETHRTDGDYCECKTTRGMCWHRAAWMLLSTLAASGARPEANLPLPNVTNEDDLPSSFLDGDFDAFEDTSLLIQVEAPVQPWRVSAARVLDVDARSQALADELY